MLDAVRDLKTMISSTIDNYLCVCEHAYLGCYTDFTYIIITQRYTYHWS